MSSCYEPNCIYSRISGFGENFADSRYVFYERRDSSRVWNSLYIVKKGGISLKFKKLRGTVAKVYDLVFGKGAGKNDCLPKGEQGQPEAGWSKERKPFSQRAQPSLV